jgi:uncharacterized membrane protein YGL010W
VSADRSPNLVAWQWKGYPEFHGDKKNLMLHALSNPMFIFGTLAVVTSPLTRWHCAVGGVVFMVVCMAIQGRGHKMEKNAPIPFDGPLDVLGRIFFEQLFNFPRFVLTGGFGRAWKAATGSSDTR